MGNGREVKGVLLMAALLAALGVFTWLKRWERPGDGEGLRRRAGLLVNALQRRDYEAAVTFYEHGDVIEVGKSVRELRRLIEERMADSRRDAVSRLETELLSKRWFVSVVSRLPQDEDAFRVGRDFLSARLRHGHDGRDWEGSRLGEIKHETAGAAVPMRRHKATIAVVMRVGNPLVLKWVRSRWSPQSREEWYLEVLGSEWWRPEE